MHDIVHDSLSPLVETLRSLSRESVWEDQLVPEPQALLQGQWDQEPLRLETRRLRHPALLHLTWALLSQAETGAYRAVTAYALPNPTSGLPILGLDYVGLGGMLAIAALDLAPTYEPTWQTLAEPLLVALEQDNEELIVRKMPDFARQVFSTRAQLVAARTPAGCQRAVEHALRVIQTYREWLLQPPHSPTDQLTGIQDWCRAMANNKKEAGALKRMFGEAADSYLQDFLFAPPSGYTAQE